MACEATSIALLTSYLILNYYSHFTNELVATIRTDISFQAPDGTIWVEVTNHSQVVTGRMPSYNVLTSRLGPTSYAKRKVVEGSIMLAFILFIDDFVIREIISCTETEA